jgi:alkanesulfonate monooxygenase SsuD/methylene tetrahydromethanopterin reductase-like flavin-dependent oxidoreductase (luciferase family)
MTARPPAQEVPGQPALRIGHLLPTRDMAAAGDDDVHLLVEVARRGEELGFDSVWAGDSPLTRPRADALIVLASVAAATRRVEVGTAVLLPALRHPVLLAHQLATLDRIAEGRLLVGVGAGFPHAATEAQFTALGAGYRQRLALLEASLAAMRQVWAGEAASVAPRPVRSGGPPIWLAGAGAAALRRVARLGDGWLPYPPRPELYAAQLRVLHETAGVDRAPAVTPAFYATVCLDADRARGRRRLRASVERYYRAPLERIETVQALFAGPAEACADWLRAYVAAGARHVVVRFAADDHLAALEEFAVTVRPDLCAEAEAAG